MIHIGSLTFIKRGDNLVCVLKPDESDSEEEVIAAISWDFAKYEPVRKAFKSTMWLALSSYAREEGDIEIEWEQDPPHSAPEGAE